MMYLVAMKAVHKPGPWADLYQRLVERGCAYDERRREYSGKKRILGRIAGQLISLLHGLLRADEELRAHIPAHTRTCAAPRATALRCRDAPCTPNRRVPLDESPGAVSAYHPAVTASGVGPGTTPPANTAVMRSGSRNGAA